jgi:hypothetical protein
MSSWLVEPDVDGVVELCAASMDTEKHNAAALVSSFFMFRLLVVDRICLYPPRCVQRSRGFAPTSGKPLRGLQLWAI